MMKLLFLLILSISSLFSHPALSNDHSESPCSTLRQSFEGKYENIFSCEESEIRSKYAKEVSGLRNSLKTNGNGPPPNYLLSTKKIQVDSKSSIFLILADCTTASLELIKKCRNGNKFDDDCLLKLHTVCC